MSRFTHLFFLVLGLCAIANAQGINEYCNKTIKSTGTFCDGSVLKTCYKKCSSISLSQGAICSGWAQYSAVPCLYGCKHKTTLLFGTSSCNPEPCSAPSFVSSAFCNGKVIYNVPQSYNNRSALLSADSKSFYDEMASSGNFTFGNASNCLSIMSTFACAANFPQCTGSTSAQLLTQSCENACTSSFYCLNFFSGANRTIDNVDECKYLCTPPGSTGTTTAARLISYLTALLAFAVLMIVV